jgi:4-hydroxybenzoate polyprenyltransferase
MGFNHLRDGILRIASFIRWRDWGPGKIPVFCTLLAYIALAKRDFSAGFLLDFLLFIFFAVAQSALGYVVNDWGDRHIDKLHGKKNAFDNLTVSAGLLRLGLLSCVAFLSGLPFVKQPVFLPLWIGWVFFTCAYSLEPLRLKERGVLGLGVSSIAQWTVPMLIAFSAMARFGHWDMAVFAIANSISGATLEIAHQRYDRAKDLSTRTETFGARIVSNKLDRLYAAALIFDKLAIACVVITVSLVLSVLGRAFYWNASAYILPAVYLVIALAAILENKREAAHGSFLDPYYSKGHSANKILHETVPNLIVPGYLLLSLAMRAPLDLILLAVFLYWRLVLGEADWLWPLRTARAYFLKG